MSVDPRYPRDDFDKIAAELRDMRRRLDELERSSGSQRNLNTEMISRQIAYLAGLKTDADTGANITLTNIVADGTFRYFTTGSSQPNATELLIDCPTGKMIVTGAVGEASITPPNNFCIIEVAVFVSDANGVNIPIGTTGCNARRYTDRREGLNMRTNDGLVTIADPIANPGPYRVRLLIGVWGAAGSSTGVTCSISSPSVTAQVIGDGVPV